MKMNKKIIRLKRFIKQIVIASERSAAILFALALVLSLGIMAVPMAGTVGAQTLPNPTFMTLDVDEDDATDISIGWSTDRAQNGSQSVHVNTSGASTRDYAMVGVSTNFVLTASTTMSYWGYTVSGNVMAPDEIWLEFSSGDVICNTGPQGTVGQWEEWTLSGSSDWYDPQTLNSVDITTFYTQSVVKVFLGAGSPTSSGVDVDVYLDNLSIDADGDGTAEYILDDDTGTIEVLCGTFCGITGCTGIQVGINAALPGDTINVANGTYTITAAITVDKAITITGNTGSPENVVVTYGSASQTLDCFDMQANNVTVQGISAVNGRYGFNFAASDPTGCTISDCVINHCYEGAINIDGGSGHTISNNTITSCLTSGTKRGVIHIYGCPDVTIDGNTLTNNGLTGANATMGIYVKYTYPSSSSERVEVINNNISGMLGQNADIQVYDAPYTYIYNNTISDSEDKGITIFGIQGNPAYTSTDNRVQVMGNTISSTYYPGLQACNAPYTYFYNNTLTQCNYYGGDGTGDFDYASIHIDAGSSNCLIDSNTVSDGINGIQIWSNDCTVTNNTIYDMGLTYADTKTTGDDTYYNSAILYGDMYDVNMPTSATISGNDIHDNYWGLFVISTYTGTVTAEENWWGDASGPHNTALNPNGAGDEVSDHVDFIPFLASSGGGVVNNVSITKSGPTSANSGVDITYTITYKNIGTNYATNVIVTETYPSEVEYVSANPAPDIGNNQWTIGTLAPGEEDAITVMVHIIK